MNLTSLVEFIGMGGGLIVALFGVWTSIRSRQRDDKQAEAKAGVEAVEHSKLMQDIAISTQNTYLQRIQENMTLMEAENERLKRRLAEALGEKGIQNDEAQGAK